MGNLTVYAADLAGTFISGFGTGAAATASVAATEGGGYVVVPGTAALTGVLATTIYFAGRAKNDSDRLKDSIEERLNGDEDDSNSNGNCTIPEAKYPGDDPTTSPGEGWEWRGPADKGSWYNPQTGETLHPDLNHPYPEGPHWDYIPYKNGPQYRIMPDGTVVPK